MTKLYLIPVLMFSLNAAAAQLNLRFSGLEPPQGQLLISVFNQPQGFPEDTRRALRLLAVPARYGNATVVIPDLAAGPHAVAVVHDINNNGKLDTNAFGMPLEPVGFSNNPSLGMSAPSFNECKFSVQEPEASINIQLKKF